MFLKSLLPVLLLTASTRAAGILYPANAADNVSPDTPLRLSFNAPPILSGHGKIQIFDAATDSPIEIIDTALPTNTQSIGTVPNFHYYPVTIDGKEADIHPKNDSLTFGKSYYIKIDAAVFQDDAGMSDKTSWHFTTKQSAPAPRETSPGHMTLTIAADGTGDFASVQGAVDSIPDNNTAPTTLFIKKGTYTGLVCFLNKHNLSFVGEDRKATVLRYANNNNFNNTSEMHIYHRGVLIAHHCNQLLFTNLTIRNTTPQGGSQAEAIILNGTPTSQASLTNLDLYSFQDTLQINGQAYIRDSYIEGDVDFMWGNGSSFFENCECKGLRSKAYFTQIRNPQGNHGFIYHHCTFDAAPNVNNIFLSRIEPARFPYSEVALIDCTITPNTVSPVAWKLDTPKGAAPGDTVIDAPNVHFWEFNSHTPDNQPLDTTRRLPTSRQLQQPQDAETITNYSNPTYILGSNYWSTPTPTSQR